MGIVKLQVKPTGKGYQSFVITIPRTIVEILRWRKGDMLAIELMENKDRKGVFIYKVR